MSMKEDVLRQLLEELLSSADETAPVGHGATVEDLDINKQVIELVVNAGLMTLPQVTLTDELRVHATRCLAAIRITVRKAPEVLVVLLHDVILSEWLLVRMCFVLCHVKDDPLRNEFIATMAGMLRVWKEANPGTWSDLRKCKGSLRSFIYMIAFYVSKEESMTAASKGEFKILISGKAAFDIRISNPSHAFLLASSLLHLLSLNLEHRDIQWLQSQLDSLSTHLEKWLWYEPVQSDKAGLQSAQLKAMSSLLRATANLPNHQPAVFQFLCRQLTKVTVDEDLTSIKSAIEDCLHEISAAARYNLSLQWLIKSSGLQSVLMASDTRKFPISLSSKRDVIIGLGNVDDSYPVSNAESTRKRRLVESVATIDGVFKVLLTMAGLLRSASQDHSTQLGMIVETAWNKSSEDVKCGIVKHIGYLACASAGKLKESHRKNPSIFECCLCDGGVKLETSIHVPVIDLRTPLLAIFRDRNVSPRVVVSAIRACRRLLRHDDSPELVQISKSPLADLVLGQLVSENRDQRIAAAQTIPLLFKDRENQNLSNVITENRNTIFSQLRNLQSSSSPARLKSLLETTVMAYAEIGKVATQANLSTVLTVLVHFLGHNNSFIAALAYREILAIARAHNQSTWQMFSPYWSTISVRVVEQMRSRPQILQRLAELLDLRDSMFLMRTQNFTVPPLVLARQRDMLELLAHKIGVRVWQMLNENMAFILAVLLTGDTYRRTADSGTEFLIELMAAHNPKVTIDTRNLIMACRTPLTVELLKMLGDEGTWKRERVSSALQTVALSVAEKPQPAQKAPDSLKNYVSNNILELMNYFTDIITDKRGRKTFTEKIGCIAGIQEIIMLSEGASKSALPQIIACLQAATEDDLLRTSAIQAWKVLIAGVQQTEVGSVIAHTFALFIQIWSRCSPKEKILMKFVVQEAITLHEQVVMTDYSIPSLACIPELQSLAKRLDDWRSKAMPKFVLEKLIRRCAHETAIICHRGLMELRDFLEEQEPFIHSLILVENCDRLVTQLIRCLLDVTSKYHDSDTEIMGLAVECLGIVGAVDPIRTDAAKIVDDIILQSNFEDAEESVGFAMSLIEHRLVGCFRAATDTRAQGYLAWAMQDLLKFCGITAHVLDTQRGLGVDQLMMRKWGRFSKQSRETLTPLLTSKYSASGNPPAVDITFPIFKHQNTKTYRDWLQWFTLAIINAAQGENARKIFTTICSHIIKNQDLGIANFILPYVVLNVIISGGDQHRENIRLEFLAVLESGGTAASEQEAAKSRLANQSVFILVDYLHKWLRQRKKVIMERRHMLAKKANRYVAADEEMEADPSIARVEAVLSTLPADLMANASFQCGSYARALFHWEQYIRDSEKSRPDDEMDRLYARWQEIYIHLDEPDGIEGISAKFKFQTFDQQILEHETAGHWGAAQSCYELALQQDPSNLVFQKGFLNCIKQSGHHETYLSQISGFILSFPENLEIYSSLAIESSWMANNWGSLSKHLETATKSGFEYQTGEALMALMNGNEQQFQKTITSLRTTLGQAIVAAGTDSSRQCYEALSKLHAVQELKATRSHMTRDSAGRRHFMSLLDERLNLMNPSPRYLQFVLALRRAATMLSTVSPAGREIASSWLSTAKIARKAGQFDEAYAAILRATELDVQMAKLEHARWWWHQGQSRKAIESLQNSFAANIFEFNRETASAESSNLSLDEVATNSHNVILGKAMALLTKWLDIAKQTSEEDLLNRYKKVQTLCDKWEKSHYLLGHYYNRLLEHEESKPANRQKDSYVQGELTRLVCHSYLTSLRHGNKYLYETLPRVLTLWLDFGANVTTVMVSKDERQRLIQLRQSKLTSINDQMERALKKLPFLPALAQVISRIMHPNDLVYKTLIKIIVTIISEYPEQTMWSLIAVIKSSIVNRALRGQEVAAKLKASSRKPRDEIMRIAQHTTRLADSLLKLCNFEISGRPASMSLTRGLGFPVHAVLPCPIVVPLQSNLTAILPGPSAPKGKKHNPYPTDQPQLQSIEDEVEIMNSMQKPRKITIRGTDGLRYPFLVKPKDDLRKDARLMEFNSIINKLLKKDVESSRRQLYIRTYSVVPLNEEHGIVEWVPHTRVLRDIILKYLRQKGIVYNYTEIRAILDSNSEDPSPAELFEKELLPRYPPVLWEWFVEEFSGPTAWFESRLKFSRTLAVMSFVGYVLGLGDRHSENILLDATAGAAVHVDFNCLFEKGQSFEKPERVPFRLTQNLVDAMGVTGYDGVFRKAGEVTMRLLRANTDTLMSVLESFIHDPLLEWNRKKKPGTEGDTEEARKALMTIKGKLGGQINKEELPLSAEGQVDELIRMAASPSRLVQMYIGNPPNFLIDPEPLCPSCNNKY